MFLKQSRKFVKQSVKTLAVSKETNKLFYLFVVYKVNKTDEKSYHYTHVIKKEYNFNSGATIKLNVRQLLIVYLRCEASLAA